MVQRQVEEEEEETLQGKEMPGYNYKSTHAFESRIRSLRGGGQPLAKTTRDFFKPRFGADFSQVRVHTDSRAAELAKAVNARAFTVGQDVAFGAGQYSPTTTEGKKLLAHELTHTIQQKGEFISNKLMKDAGAPPPTPKSPTKMRKVISGTLEGSKKVSDYYPDLAGRGGAYAGNKAGPFDTGKRAGSVVQLIGEIPSGVSHTEYTFKQAITISKLQINGKAHAMEGKTIDDIKRSGRDQSKAPFRQVWGNSVSICDPITGVPYNTLRSYHFKAKAKTSIEHKAGASKSVNWGVEVQASGGKVTKNTAS